MPTITADPELRNQMFDIMQEEYKLDAPRTGIHVSDLTHCLSRTYWDRTDRQPLSQTEVGLFSIGWAMERSMISRLHVEPFEVDGITMSLDFRLPDGTIADLKTTRMAPGGRAVCAVCSQPRGAHFTKDILDHKYAVGGGNGFEMPAGWLGQFAAYRYGWNHRLEERAKMLADMGLITTSGEGNTKDELLAEVAYSFGVVVVHLIQPEITTWRVTWTPQELNNAWVDTVARARTLEGMLENGNPMPYQHRLGEWECQGCSRSLDCALAASLQGARK